MKNLLVALLLLSFGTSAFADCKSAYKRASYKRDVRNEIIVGVAIVGTGAGAIYIPAASSFFLMGYMLTLTGASPAAEAKRQGSGFYKNNFDQLIDSFEAAKVGSKNKTLKRIVKKSLRKADLASTPELEAKVKEILVEGYENEMFCPVVKIKKNGREKYAVFNESALVEYISLNL